ncbi:MAG: type 1 glutamine amidotransferase domain-containing protein [Candidatus Eremiobacteraeota bacterium]|nr:type 1 glutamine amidotransferase domain-containing protein [Candidatus Eremiobacteraeota bacterium]
MRTLILFALTMLMFTAITGIAAAAGDQSPSPVFTDERVLPRDYRELAPLVPVNPAILQNDEVPWESAGEGMRRKVFFNDRLTVVLLQIERPAKPGEKLQCHCHAHDQITFILDGKAKVEVGKKIKEIGTGDCYIVPSNVRHGMVPLSQRLRILDMFTPTREDFRPAGKASAGRDEKPTPVLEGSSAAGREGKPADGTVAGKVRREKILLIVTAAPELVLKDGTRRETGYWAEEVAVPLEIFRKAGYRVDVATAGGRPPHVDRGSLSAQGAGGEEKAARYRALLDNSAELKHPHDLEKIEAPGLREYGAIFIAGGHGVLQDLATSKKTGIVLAMALKDPSLIIGTVCHGPAAFAALRLAGESLPKAISITGFSEAEEKAAGLWGRVPFELEGTLKAMGASYRQGDVLFAPFVVESDQKARLDGREATKIVSGQNPASSEETAKKVVENLEKLRQ